MEAKKVKYGKGEELRCLEIKWQERDIKWERNKNIKEYVYSQRIFYISRRQKKKKASADLIEKLVEWWAFRGFVGPNVREILLAGFDI